MDREWITHDFYADLGVARSATAEEIAERYRERAWELHPDRRPGDGAAEAEFKRLAAAYAVLGTPLRRASYDEVRDRVFDRGFDPAPGTTRPTTPRARSRGFRLSARGATGGGIACLVLGVLVAGLVLMVTGRDDRIRTDGVRTTAVVSAVSPEPRLRFVTQTGETVEVPAPRVRDRRNRGYRMGERLPIHYLVANPSELVIDESTTARDITMWIIAIKLLLCGIVLLGLGARQRRLDSGSVGELRETATVRPAVSGGNLAEPRN